MNFISRMSSVKAASLGKSVSKSRRPVCLASLKRSKSEWNGSGTFGIRQNSRTHVPLMHLWSGPEPAASGMPPWSYRSQAPRTLQEGELIHSEVFGQFGLRGTQHQLTIAIGEVPPNIERAAASARACYDAGLRALRPGVRFEEVCSQMLKPVLDAGGWLRGPQIHSLNPLIALCGRPTKLEQLEGAERCPDVGTAPTLLADIGLEPGMTFAFEPSCTFGRHLVTLGGW